MIKSLANFLEEEQAQGLTEYGLIIALVAVVVIAVLTLMGGQIRDKFTEITDALN